MPSNTVFERSLGRRFAVIVLVALTGLVAFGWFVDRIILEQEGTAVADEMQAMLDSSARSVTAWLDDRRTYLTILVRAKRLREGVEEALRNRSAVPMLRDALASFAVPFNLANGALVDEKGVIRVDIDDNASTGHLLPANLMPYLARAWKGTPCITPPMCTEVGTSGTASMFAMAAVNDAAGRPLVVLVLTIDPKVFSALLDQTRPGTSGESEAFDRDGRMLNESRFLEQIIAAGVLPEGTTTTILTLDLRNPGVDIRTGKRSTLPVKAQPLTRMVASAIEGGRGVDVDGFYDYRGVRCVGAWTWIAPYDFGLAVKMDYSEAFSTLGTVRKLFVSVFGLLVVAVLAVMGWSYVGASQQHKLAEAQLKAEKLGQYTLVRKLGEGGMGEVYLGHHALLRRATAIKIMRSASAEDDRKRFEREVQLGCRLSNPNTIAIFDFGHTVDGRFYYAMEYLDGMDLATVVGKYGALPPARVIHLLAQVCGSLAEAHDMHLIHRDIKPENIMVCLRGGVPDLVKVLDFGLVKSLDASSPRVTVSTTICGTPAFIAPEAVQGRTIDARADLYSVAAVGYFLLTGVVLFERATVMDTLMAQISDPPRSFIDYGVSVPPDLSAVIMRGLSKTPEDRQQCARALRDELLACACAAEWTENNARAWWAGHASTATEGGPLEEKAIAVATPAGGALPTL